MRAFYRGYNAATGRRAKQVRRLHVMREDGKFAGQQGLCGAPGWGVTQSPPIILDPMPEQPPTGLDWCHSCVGHAAHHVGMLNRLAVTVAELAREQAEASKPTPPPSGPCGRCRQTRPLFPFSWVPDGWAEFKEIRLCARCHSLSALEDEDGRLDSTPLLEQIGALS
ncbi:hypothetical protein SMD44_00989 [Streptomyces alboflavus]|uniref:Uncharacterized protein n=1 Tax=Streptomyces alboflavus TaxID=67267 RepID=A0A1Z1W594_9ACTN|nr:hypothetical protein [Streptomyces alboflavus]ARX81591.1 hypothetical protein SMD44_00989 [Streptomyces alboflavus]